MQGLTLQLWPHVNLSPTRASLPHASDSLAVLVMKLCSQLLSLHKHGIAKRRGNILLDLSHSLLNSYITCFKSAKSLGPRLGWLLTATGGQFLGQLFLSF